MKGYSKKIFLDEHDIIFYAKKASFILNKVSFQLIQLQE